MSSKFTTVLVAVGLFVFGLIVSNAISFPQAVTASIDFFSAERTESGTLHSGLGDFKQELLIGVEGLWSLLFAGGVTGLGWLFKGVHFLASVVDGIMDSKIAEPEGFDPRKQSFEQILIDGAYEGDPEAIEFAVNRLAMNGKKFSVKDQGAA